MTPGVRSQIRPALAASPLLNAGQRAYHRVHGLRRGRDARPGRVSASGVERLETVLRGLSLFEHLRTDEIGRVVPRFQLRRLAAGESLAHAAGPGEARMVVLVSGVADLE